VAFLVHVSMATLLTKPKM